MNQDITDTPQRVKLTMETEDGKKFEFVTDMEFFRPTPFDLRAPHREQEWHGVKLIPPPQYNFRGSTFGPVTLILPP